MTTTDAFGVPEYVLGSHDDQFYGAVGRVACLAAVIEERLRVLLQTLRHANQAAFSKMPVGKVLVSLRSDTSRVASTDRECQIVTTYLGDASEAFQGRNDVLHSLWPAQDDGTWFRHRLDPNGVRVAVRTGPDEVLDLISEFVQLERQWPNVYSIIGGWSRLLDR